jgi:hypothetical protein
MSEPIENPDFLPPQKSDFRTPLGERVRKSGFRDAQEIEIFEPLSNFQSRAGSKIFDVRGGRESRFSTFFSALGKMGFHVQNTGIPTKAISAWGRK